jgi:hypothetical protein
MAARRPAGHMTYVHEEARVAHSADIAAFVLGESDD